MRAQHERDEHKIVRVWLLGDFRVSLGARSIGEKAWALRKAAAIVKLLALSPGRRLHREQVMNLLWPHLGRQAAANNLRRTLHAARRALDPDLNATNRYLALQGGQIALCPDYRHWVDVVAFKDAAATARRTLDPAAYRAALDLYAGDLLPEDRYEEWVEGSRTELRTLYLALLVELAGLYEERGEYTKAIEESRRILSEEPTREEAHAGLMRLYALSGKRGEALRQYERLESILRDEIGVEPTAESQNLRGEIMTGSFSLETDHPSGELPGPAQHNLPEVRTSFVGREREVLEVRQSLAMTGLLTLTGAGGAGKTRLALEVAQESVSFYPDGVWLVELAGLSDGALVPQAVASALEVREQPGRSLMDTLADAIGEKNMLLLLDNCEHLTNAASRVAEALLSSCPRLKILATSREPLNAPGEVTWRVPSLSVPPTSDLLPTAEDLGRHGAIRLFVERARLKLPTFELTPDNARAIAEVCQKLEGMPLAIELAAARMDVFAPEQLSERLHHALVLLTSAERAKDPRHQTLEATLDWSYDLLAEPERRLFARLSVFTGGFSLEAAEAVGAGDGIETTDVLKPFLSLVDKSLVIAEVAIASHDGGMRYRMLETVRLYGHERLEGRGEAEVIRRRHAEFFLSLAEEAEPHLRGSEQAAWFERLDAENGNLRTALSWSLERGAGDQALRLSGALGDFWHVRGYLEEGRRWLEAALASGDDAPATIKALLHAGWMAWEQLDYERSQAFGEKALALAREQGDRAAAGRALYILGAPILYQLELDRAAALFEEAAQLQRGVGDVAGLARTSHALGLTAIARQDFELATQLYEECLAIAREAGDQLVIVVALGMGAFAFLGKDDHRRAGELFREGLQLSRSIGTKHGIVFHLHAAAALASAQEQPVRSARLWGAGESLMDDIGTGLAPVERYHYGPYIASARALLDEAGWDVAWAEGKAMTREQAVEYALGTEALASHTTSAAQRVRIGSADESLTRREREIASLLARGLTMNRQISAELFISERTVETHVRNILKKLGLDSRAQLAVWATERWPFDVRS